ncbi:MAG TPA: hypothetical protein VE422_17380 [Terriglobia bacterium]|nr:hypothetical protein [Terriglobia bacterium]
MKTKLTTLFTFVAVIVLPLMPLVMDAQTRRSGRSSSVSADGLVTDCGDIRVTYARRPAITEQTEMTLSPSQVSALRAQLTNSGIYISGWDRNEYSVKTCKAVPADDPNPSSTLRAITTTNANGRLSVDGPNNSEWTANLIIMVPRLSSMDLQTVNGPLGLHNLAGNIQLSASNGPISLDNVGGIVQATTTNGPISVKGATGDHRLTATNGPISVKLSGGGWDGPGLEASTQNGPLTLSIPDGYASGISIQASEQSPVSCRAPACARATRSLGTPSTIRIGNGEPIVRLSTVNGPLSIQAPKN